MDSKIRYRQPKCDAKSKLYRDEGNAYYAKNTQDDYYYALVKYNLSISFAQSPEMLCLGYTNRSATCFQLKLYQKCVENIELARNTNACPETILTKLLKREGECKRLLEAMPIKTVNILKLDSEANKDVPFVANCVEIQDRRNGGKIISNREIRSGEIIAIEEAFCSVIPNRYVYGRCENCCGKFIETLIPCLDCTAAMFCDEKCYNMAMQRFHRFECPVIDFMRIELPKAKLILPLRAAICGLSIFGSLEKISDFVENFHENVSTVFDFDHTKPLKPHEEYGPVYSMPICNIMEKMATDLQSLKRVCGAILLHSKLVTDEQNLIESLEKLMLIIKQHYLAFELKSFRLEFESDINLISVLRIDPVLGDFTEGIFRFGTLLKHFQTTNPQIPDKRIANVGVYACGSKTIFYSSVFIQAGEQLYLSDTRFYIHPKAVRNILVGNKFQKFYNEGQFAYLGFDNGLQPTIQNHLDFVRNIFK